MMPVPITLVRFPTPWHARQEIPKRGSFDGPICSIIVDERWRKGLTYLAGHRCIQVLYWMHRERGRRGIGRGLPFRDAPGNRMTTSPTPASSHGVSPRAQGVDVSAFARSDAVSIDDTQITGADHARAALFVLL
jgi:hypothetical protein